MSATEITEQIQMTGGLLTFTIFEQKLMRNFFIINSKLKKLDQIQQLDIKLKALEKQQKFMANKMEAMAQKLPKDSQLSRNDMKNLIKDQFFDTLNSKDDRLTNSKFAEDILKQVNNVKVDLAKMRVQGGEQILQRSNSLGGGNSKNSLTAGQILLQQSKKVPRQTLNEVLDKNELNVVDNILKAEEQNNPLVKQINKKFEDIYQRLEEYGLGKMFNDYGEKEIQRFDKYQKYEQKSQVTARKLKQKPMRLDGIKNENIKGELLKNDLYAQYQKAQSIRAEMRKTDGKKNQKGLLGYKDDIKNGDVLPDSQSRLKPSKSIKKLDRIERRLKVDDIKQLNGVLKQIELRIQGRVTHQIFMGFVEDIEQKLQILRITKDSSNQLSELRKMIYSLENRLQAIIIFLQNSTNQDDALFVKKQWTCVSCDKNLDKYNAKIGQHLNWDHLSSKKISPTKAGAFGQTGQLASKIRSLMQNQKSMQE